MIRVFQLFDQGTFGDGKFSWLQQFIGRFDFVNQLTVDVRGNEDDLSVSRLEAFWKQLSRVIVAPQIAPTLNASLNRITLTGKNNRFPFLDILENTQKNPKFGRVRQVPIRELGWEFLGWDLSALLGFLWVFFKYRKISKNGNPLFFPVSQVNKPLDRFF